MMLAHNNFSFVIFQFSFVIEKVFLIPPSLRSPPYCERLLASDRIRSDRHDLVLIPAVAGVRPQTQWQTIDDK